MLIELKVGKGEICLEEKIVNRGEKRMLIMLKREH
jgi:hypothetical protein